MDSPLGQIDPQFSVGSQCSRVPDELQSIAPGAPFRVVQGVGSPPIPRGIKLFVPFGDCLPVVPFFPFILGLNFPAVG